MSSQLKLFISYSHEDEGLIKSFIKHITPLKSSSLVEEWYDREILGGDTLFQCIDENFIESDIICLFISPDFLSSDACMKEKSDAISLMNKKGIKVFPIILKQCLWSEYNDISQLLAFPTDGTPVSTFKDQDEAWTNVVRALKKAIEDINKTKSITISSEFNKFLKSADLLTYSHSEKEKITLNDIFVYPKLNKYTDVGEVEKYDSNQFNQDLLSLGKIIIAGDSQSGKTSLCKILFNKYRDFNLIPVYIRDNNKFLGNPDLKIKNAFEEQYIDIEFEEINKNRIVPIIDDFHFAKHQEKIIDAYESYQHQVLVVDDIYELDIKKESIIKDYDKFSIIEFPPTLRDELLTKWINIRENDSIKVNPNHLYGSLDEKAEKIENSLGKVFGKGIMPAYPFFILTILSAYESKNPLDQDITSQGHCYQALIYLYLKKQGVNNDKFDIYLNFLTELAHAIFVNEGNGLSKKELDEFIIQYKNIYNLPIDVKKLLLVLKEVNFSSFDSFGQYNFCYPYLYYFFVAKYLSDKLKDNKSTIDNIINNLHKNENAYIAIFISHHSKSDYLLDEIMLNAHLLFDGFDPATLDANELSFFDDHKERIVNAVLPSKKETPKRYRRKILVSKDELELEKNESFSSDKEQDIDQNKIEDATEKLIIDLRRSVKTVEVMGQIIKNRSGSLELSKLEEIFEAGLLVHLRILSSFFQLIKEEELQSYIVEFVVSKIKMIIDEQGEEIELKELEKLAKTIFWNLNFSVVLGFISKAIHSLGSVNLINVSNTVSQKLDSPSSFIVHHGIKMWFEKSLRVEEFSNKIESDGFSNTAKKVMKFKIVEHSKLHKIKPRDMTKIEKTLDIPRAALLSKKNI